MEGESTLNPRGAPWWSYLGRNFNASSMLPKSLMRVSPKNGFLTIPQAVRGHWRGLRLVSLAIVGGVGYWGYRKVQAILNPAVPKAMVLNMVVPDDVSRSV